MVTAIPGVNRPDVFPPSTSDETPAKGGADGPHGSDFIVHQNDGPDAVTVVKATCKQNTLSSTVICADILEEIGRALEKEFDARFGSGKFIFRRCNGREENEISELLRFAQTHFGHLDIVVNNVGIVDETNWQSVMDLNLGTTVRVTNATLDLLGRDKGGNGAVLVHTASNGGLIPAFFAPFYCATKAAMVHYTRSWAHEVNYRSHGVRMFTICPRMTDTDFLQQNVDPKKVVKLDHLLTVMNFSDKTKMLSPSAVGEALIKGLEDDSLNGVALQLLTEEPRVLFVDQNSLIVTSDSVTTGLVQKATQ